MIDLYLGDCLELLKNVHDNSIDLVVTSPPYDNLRTYNDTLDWNFEKFQQIASELERVLKKGGVIVWIVADATIAGSETGSSFKQALYFNQIGLNIHDTMIWEKPTFTAVGTLKSRYASVFEYMFIFSKGAPKTFNPIKDRQNLSVNRKISGTIRQSDGTFRNMQSEETIKSFGQRFNVWHIPAEMSSKKRCHPAQFPEVLVRDHIVSWSNEGDTILDCFMGSGTVGKMCKLLNRDFIGMEIVPEYFEIARKRINEVAEIEKENDNGN